jgi:hypothetical protein
MRIFTIGYEGTTMGEFLAVLAAAGVERVIGRIAGRRACLTRLAMIR